MFSEHVAISPRRWMYLPIHIKLRELDGNALLAFEAAEQGWGVILGRKVPEGTYDWPRGILFQKDFAPNSGKYVSTALHWRGRGGKIVGWCEEGLVYPNPEEYGQRKLDRELFGMLERYYCWGQNQAEDLVDKLGCDSKTINVTGNPRFDLHRAELRAIFEDRVQRIKRKHAPFILINTTFSRYNSDLGGEAKIAKMRELGRVQTDEQEAHQRGRAEFQSVGFEKFMELIDELSRQFPAHTIIIRPHPNEKVEPWCAKAATLTNVKVVFEGNVIDWILASELCIQNNCMTGVEAYLLGKPAISYRPMRDERFDLFLPNALTIPAFSLEGVIDLVYRILRDENVLQKTDADRQVEISQHFVSNASGKRACERIMETVAAMDVPELPLSFRAKRLSTFRGLLHEMQSMLRGEEFRRNFVRRQTRITIHGWELANLLEKSRLATGRFCDVRIYECEGNTFCIC